MTENNPHLKMIILIMFRKVLLKWLQFNLHFIKEISKSYYHKSLKHILKKIFLEAKFGIILTLRIICLEDKSLFCSL